MYSEKKELRRKKMVEVKKYKFCYLLLLPAIVSVFIFQYIPLGGVIIAFQDYNIIKGIFGSPFIGLQNFVDIFTKPVFSDKIFLATKNTLFYSFLVVVVGQPFPILFAVMLNEIKNAKFKKVTQTISYLPYFLSWVAVGGMFYSVFATYGVWNDICVAVAEFFGKTYERRNLMMDASNFPAVVFFTNLWKTLGWNSIVYLAAIAGINQELYDAAKVDGCNRLQQIIYITLPSIMQTVLILFIMSLGGMFSFNFDQVFNLQNPFVQEQTEIIGTITYRFGFQQAEYSFTMAFSMIQSLLNFLILWCANKVTKWISGVGIW